MPYPIQKALILIVTSVFYCCNAILVLRILLELIKVRYYNPMVQSVIKISEPGLRPLRKILPRIKTIDTAALLVLILFTFLKLEILFMIQSGDFPSIIAILILIIPDVINLVIDIFFWAILIGVFISWVPQLMHSPIAELLESLASPIMHPIRKIIPNAGGFDISPLFAILMLKLTSVLLVEPLMSFAYAQF